MKKYLAEFIGTLTLVLVGCGAAVIAGDKIGYTGIAFAFGLALVAMAYGIGPVSGCHINPGVSLAAFTAGRLSGKDLLGYIIFQFLGGLAGATILLGIVNGQLAGYDVMTKGLGQNGWGAGYLGEYNQMAAMIFEFVGSVLFFTVILGSTRTEAPWKFAGLAIGLSLTALHLLGISVTGVSLNPARSLGPALLVGGQAMSQVWLFLLVPSIAGVLTGLGARILESTDTQTQVRLKMQHQ